jgi:hypothetical protein
MRVFSFRITTSLGTNEWPVRAANLEDAWTQVIAQVVQGPISDLTILLSLTFLSVKE